jgi:uncharacterized spore protein YtfJ
MEGIQMTLKEDEDVARAVAAPSKSVVVRLAAQIGSVVNAQAVFGAPVEREGVTVIPVAKAAWGFGGGGGSRLEDEGSGGGGLATVTPQGFIEIRNGEASYRPMRPRPAWHWIAMAASLAVVVVRLTREVRK